MNNTQFDYVNQAWTVDGRYVACGHIKDSGGRCQFSCYGTLHAGQPMEAEQDLCACGAALGPDGVYLCEAGK